jgi:hypothetical protein
LHQGKNFNFRVVYNGLNRPLSHWIENYRALFWRIIATRFVKGYVLHVGGNQYYKKIGVIAIYSAWRSVVHTLPLLLMGAAPSAKLGISKFTI